MAVHVDIPPTGGLALETIRALIAEAVRPGRFFVAAPSCLEWEEHPAEEISWEIYRGRLLDAAQTRERQTFAAWNLFWRDAAGRSAEPLLAVKLDPASRQVHVVRSILSYAWEAYDEGDQVIRSRPVRKWLRELVVTLDGARYRAAQEFQEDLQHGLFQAVVGVSRLPLTSVEAPLPAFSLGQLAYLSGTIPLAAATTVVRSWADLLGRMPHAQAIGPKPSKLLETLLRATPAQELAALTRAWVCCWEQTGHARTDLPALFLNLFDDVALSPWTDFAEKTLRFLQLLEDQNSWTARQHADFLSALLRRLARHLTAFDLVKFHHRGANYPDALLLDAVLRSLLNLIERQPDLFLADDEPARLRRRGLRQGWLLRCRYEGHAVPEVPTSPGENARVLPAPFPHLTDAQILNPAQRSRRLFVDEPLPLSACATQVWQQSLRDLDEPAELRELGTALFLDRPLGKFKRPGEPDRTPLLSYVAYSTAIAQRQLQLLWQHASSLLPFEEYRERLHQQAPLPSVPLELYSEPPRPGVPSLQDAFQVAPDFVLLQTSRRAVGDFLAGFDWQPLQRRLSLEWLFAGRRILIVGGGAVQGTRPGTLRLYDAALRPRLEFGFEPQAGYRYFRAGEFPGEGLQLLRVWEAEDERDVRAEDLWLRPWHPGREV